MINKGVINNIDIYNLYYLFYFINKKSKTLRVFIVVQNQVLMVDA